MTQPKEFIAVYPLDDYTHKIFNDSESYYVSQFMPDVDDWSGFFNAHGMKNEKRHLNSEWTLQEIDSPQKEQIWILSFPDNPDMSGSSEEGDYIVCHYSHHKP